MAAAAAAAPSASAMVDSLRLGVSSSAQGLASPPQHFFYDIASSLHQHHLRHDQSSRRAMMTIWWEGKDTELNAMGRASKLMMTSSQALKHEQPDKGFHYKTCGVLSTPRDLEESGSQ